MDGKVYYLGLMFNTIAILGAGTMGQGLARLFVRNKCQVVLYDPFNEALSGAAAKLSDPSRPGSPQGNIRFTGDLAEAVGSALLVIECAPEDLDVKKELYRRLGALVRPDAIVASNTSTFPLRTLAEGQSFAHRLLITHFFNPADIVPLVEIIVSAEMLPEVSERVAAFLRDCGKVPVVLKKDIKGFVANRLQAAVLREACFLVGEGVVDPSQVDTVMMEGIGLRWALAGPFQISDFGGLDIWEKVMDNLAPDLDNGAQAPALIREKVKQKQLGLKTGTGFFEYPDEEGKRQADAWLHKLKALIESRNNRK